MMFAYSENQDGATTIFKGVVDAIKTTVKKEEICKIEPYWKIKGIYVIEASVYFENEMKYKLLALD
ncbi:hypothetical protein [Pelosinus sp. IPA-1]|uniref:hypothetical protein n=1 Tax=Pelosinus sp. IPA-1 TaxID=3029569 RepID=UPI0024362AFA|nr:hypothetical protein [Pelosinus sp. IPA-1]GMA99505.1 hypothetical protein PIPA1_23050 [Pelosinus sp. IPA-1]